MPRRAAPGSGVYNTNTTRLASRRRWWWHGAGAAIRIISWNLRLLVGPAVASQAALIARLSPDIACLQEANSNSIQTLGAQSGLPWRTSTGPLAVTTRDVVPGWMG